MEWKQYKGEDSIPNSMDTNLSKVQMTVKDRRGRHAAVREATESWTRLND